METNTPRPEFSGPAALPRQQIRPLHAPDTNNQLEGWVMPSDDDQSGYGRLVQDGHYSHAPSGLWGKYDNVRRIWEDQISRFAIRPALERLLATLQTKGRGLRVVDLGCGSGEAWHLLRRIPLGVKSRDRRYLLGINDFEAFHGIDLCPEMVTQCVQRFQNFPKTSFAQGNLNDPDRCFGHLPPFDLYYNSYGSLSHLDDIGLQRLVSTVLGHQSESFVLMLDVHGQYSPEWPGYWGYSLNANEARMQPYNMVYMYPTAERARRLAEQGDYRVRYWGGAELRDFLLRIPGLSERLLDLTLTDRSVFVGRHMDTAAFDPKAKPIRRAVNSLFEFNRVAKPEQLTAPKLANAFDPAINAFFASYKNAWNTLVEWFDRLTQGKNPVDPKELCAPLGPLPSDLEHGLQAVVSTSKQLSWFNPGDPEANLLQPQFGLLLRQLEFMSQRGLGCGHGLLAVVQCGPKTKEK